MEVLMTTPRRKPKVRLNVKQNIPNFHYGEMKEIARLKPRQLAAKYGLTEYTTENGRRFWFRDNGSKVLFVAHTDSVQSPGVFQPVRFKGDTWIFSPTHDDRLGVYIGLAYLPKAKVSVDILLTEDEEMGKSTALWFDPPKKYNWMFSFDKKGDGCTLYQYKSEAMRYRLGKHNFVVEQGLYSCIHDLEHLGCVGINFGTAYYDYHSEEAYASMKTLSRQLRKFISFHDEFKFVSMLHDVGYERFAESVTYHEWEYKRDQQAINMIGPKFKEESFTDAEVVDFEDIDPKKKAKEILSLATVDENGKIIGLVSDRFMKKLYYPIDVINHDISIINILRNTFNCNFVYDVAQLSAYKLVSSGYFTLADANKLVKEIGNLGFKMPLNVQGLKEATKHELENALGWKVRGKHLETPRINKPIKTNERLELVGEQKKKDKIQYSSVETKLSSKDILMYPLPDMQNVKEMIEKSRQLVEQGYNIEYHFKCTECEQDNTFDIMTHNKIPRICTNCQTDAEKHTSSTAIEVTEAEVFTKIKLLKEPKDETIFELKRGSKGKGVDKYHWIKPEPRRVPEGQVGFIKSNSD